MSEWISVKDRLPERGLSVLAIDEYDCYFIGFVDKDGDWWEVMGGMCSKTVTHWMPLPSTEGLK